MEKKSTSISIRYIDTELFENLESIVKEKKYNAKNKKDLIEYVLRDYVNMNHFYNDDENPYLVKMLKSIIESSCNQLEKNLGGRLMKLVAEEAINQGILNRIIIDFLNKYPTDQNTEELINRYRQKAVEDLREPKPITYMDLLKEEDD